MCFMSNLNNSQLSAQCYDVETITIGSDYVYKLITDKNEGPGEYVICGTTSLHRAVVTGLVGTVSTIPLSKQYQRNRKWKIKKIERKEYLCHLFLYLILCSGSHRITRGVACTNLG